MTLKQTLWEWWGSPEHPAEWDGREGGGRGSQRFWEYLWALNNLPACTRVLDVGSGVGFFAELMRTKIHEVFTVDPAADADYRMTLEDAVSTPNMNPWEPRWDCITCISVLEHVEDKPGFCKALNYIKAPIILTCELSHEADVVTMPMLYECLKEFKNHHITKMESCPVWADNSYGGKWRPFGIYLEMNQ